MKTKWLKWNKKALTAAPCLVAAAAMLTLVNHPAVVGVSAATRQLPIYCVQQDYKVCALSFDAAWADVRQRTSA